MKFGFIGCGNMGGALAKSVARVTKDIMLTSKSGEKAQALAKELGVQFGSNIQTAEQCDCIFIAVKPNAVENVLREIGGIVAAKQKVIISMAAGIEIKQIAEWLGANVPIIRIMPNTPVEVGKGVVLYSKNYLVGKSTENDFLNALSRAGMLVNIAEAQMNAGCALSGCGPAFVFQMIEALSDGAVACGLSRADALRLAAKTLEGAASLMLETKEHPAALKDKVCSPGGSTIEGVLTLEARGFRSAVSDAVVAAFRKNNELGKKN